MNSAPLLYSNGIDEQRPDYKKAYEYFLKAAAKGHSEAQYRVGVALYYGKGIGEDKETALNWLHKAAKQRNQSAQLFVKQLEITKEEINIEETAVNSVDMATGKMDSLGVLYSSDGRKLLHYSIDEKTGGYDSKKLKQQSLKYYEVPEGVEIICDSAFSECESIEEIVLPSSVRLIGTAFDGCLNLEKLIIPEGVKSIDSYTFSGCTSLENLVLPKSLVSIDASALTGVKSVISYSSIYIVRDGCLFSSDMKTLVYFFHDERTFFKIPYGVECIGPHAFEQSCLHKITIPNTVKQIEDDAFSGCGKLQDIAFPSSITRIGVGAFYECKNFFDIRLPESLEYIGNSAFKDCQNLTYIYIPNSVKIIDHWAFQNTNLKTIRLPERLVRLGNNPFAGSPLVCIESSSENFIVKDMAIYSKDCKTLILYYGNDRIFRIPNHVEKIMDCSFAQAYSIQELIIPNSVKEIGFGFLLNIVPDKIVIPRALKDKVIEQTNNYMKKNIIVDET